MPRGGKRTGAGRPKGAGLYGETTTSVRVPISMVSAVKRFTQKRGVTVPLYSSRVQAGLPEPADDEIEGEVDLIQHLTPDPDNTFLIRATGESMIDAGIREGDLLVVNRSIKATNGKMIIAAMDGQLTVKFLSIRGGKAYLKPANPKFTEIPVDEENGIVIWGVVTNSIQSH